MVIQTIFFILFTLWYIYSVKPSNPDQTPLKAVVSFFVSAPGEKLLMHDIVGNLHLHTTSSDGTGTHDEVAAAAVRAGLDFIVYTDHNTWTSGIEGWHHDPATGRDILRLMGQEVNDQHREPECNHLLCHFVCSDLNGVAADPQQLIDTAQARGGLTFLAHPFERPTIEPEYVYPWVDWDIEGFTGLELWNAMSDAKWRLNPFIPLGILGAYIPNWVFSAPFSETLAKWDELLATGQKVVAIGNSDAHAMSFTWKMLTRTVYPYEFCFRAINTHLLLTNPLADEVNRARLQIYNALKSGHCYVSYDLIASPTGFTFSAASGSTQVIMGDTLSLHNEAVLQITSPHKAKLRLIKDGQLLLETKDTHIKWVTTEPGVYRVEAYRRYWGQQKGWVFTNPIYIVTTQPEQDVMPCDR